ncbi:MAG: 3-phosphoshikimate 1-carboxyvinyltransferase [Deferribacteraceae bacterium]|jgi:3-phosphoshikimate 1-carboxyvinyltransferase|nr:3-phosphoshikimate 1-carboxyvinyltransferase [Deferribacteraceae bacterium]
MNLKVEKSELAGVITVPASKSQTMRSIIFASLAEGTSRIKEVLPSPDTDRMIYAVSAMGTAINRNGNDLIVHGVAGKPVFHGDVIDAGNSGQVLRFCAALAALSPNYTIFTGDRSIRTLRPMQPLLDGLSGLGVFAVSAPGNGYAPIIVKGGIARCETELDGEDSQPVSALLILASVLDGKITEVRVRNPGEKPWIELTLYWLNKLGVTYKNENYERYSVTGGEIKAFNYTVPGDFSSAAFPIAAALVTGSEITLENLDLSEPQGDKIAIDIFSEMGGGFAHVGRSLKVFKKEGLKGIDIDINSCIDFLPILAVTACFASTPTRIRGAAAARKKESDRIAAIAGELRKMGGRIEEHKDGLTVHPSNLLGALVYSHKDHRIAMSLAVAGLAAGSTEISDTACIDKSFPRFADIMNKLGGKIF